VPRQRAQPSSLAAALLTGAQLSPLDTADALTDVRDRLALAPRSLGTQTFFMYLSTPEHGGGTRFADLNTTVPAVKGSAVLWPSVMDEDPAVDEPMTHHEGLPPDTGIKYAANVVRAAYAFTDLGARTHARTACTCRMPCVCRMEGVPLAHARASCLCSCAEPRCAALRVLAFATLSSEVGAYA
jgi:hypothetical protein